VRGGDTRNSLKLAAQRLFAARGVDGVTVREIIAASRQRNSGALHYYFGTKEALVRELVVDGAKIVDDRRNSMLDAMESHGGPHDVREVIEVLVWPSTGLGIEEGTEGSYTRFVTSLQMNNYALFMDALQNKWNSAFTRCLDYIRLFLPNTPTSVLNQRMVFMGFLLGASLSAREAAFNDHSRAHPLWEAPHTMDNLIDTIEAMLEGAISLQTQEKLTLKPTSLKRPRAKVRSKLSKKLSENQAVIAGNS
jgi:AcrR family transcriptional regulator